MDLFKLHPIYRHGPLSRAFVLRVLLLSAAVAVLPFITRDTPLDPDSTDAGCGRHGIANRPFSPESLDSVVLALLEGGHLSVNGQYSLCLGPGRAVASAAMRRLGFPPDQLVVSASEDACGTSEYLPFDDDSFDFVLSAGLRWRWSGSSRPAGPGPSWHGVIRSGPVASSGRRRRWRPCSEPPTWWRSAR